MVVLISAALIVVFAAIKFWNLTGESCEITSVNGLLPTGSFVAVIGAFFLGGLLGKLPHRRPPHVAAGTAPPAIPIAGTLAQLGLTVFAGLIAFAWWYETKAVADPSFHPITYYIMCIRTATQDTDGWAVVVFLAAGLIAGRWLWHQEGSFW